MSYSRNTIISLQQISEAFIGADNEEKVFKMILMYPKFSDREEAQTAADKLLEDIKVLYMKCENRDETLDTGKISTSVIQSELGEKFKILITGDEKSLDFLSRTASTIALEIKTAQLFEQPKESEQPIQPEKGYSIRRFIDGISNAFKIK